MGRISALQIRTPSGESFLPRVKEEVVCEPWGCPRGSCKGFHCSVNTGGAYGKLIFGQGTTLTVHPSKWKRTQTYWKFWDFRPGISFERNVCCLETRSCLMLTSSLQGPVSSLISAFIDSILDLETLGLTLWDSGSIPLLWSKADLDLGKIEKSLLLSEPSLEMMPKFGGEGVPFPIASPE